MGAESGRVIAGCWDGRRMRLEELHRFPNGAAAIFRRAVAAAVALAAALGATVRAVRSAAMLLR